MAFLFKVKDYFIFYETFTFNPFGNIYSGRVDAGKRCRKG